MQPTRILWRQLMSVHSRDPLLPAAHPYSVLHLESLSLNCAISADFQLSNPMDDGYARGFHWNHWWLNLMSQIGFGTVRKHATLPNPFRDINKVYNIQIYTVSAIWMYMAKMPLFFWVSVDPTAHKTVGLRLPSIFVARFISEVWTAAACHYLAAFLRLK